MKIMTKGEKKDERLGAEERYKALVETAGDGIFSVDLLGRFIFANPAAASITGYSEEELLGKHFREFLPTKSIPACLNMFQRLLRGHPTPPIEIEFVTKQGEKVPLELLGTSVKRGGKVVEIVGIARDITERKQAEEALRESEEQLRAQYKGIPVPTYTWQRVGEDLTLLDYNDAAGAMTHGNVAHFVGKKASEMYRDRPDIMEDLSRCFTEKTIIKREMEYRFTTTGENKHLAVNYVFVPPDLVMVHTEDITERKRAEEALGISEERYKKQFEEAMDAIFIADAETGIIVDCNRVASELIGREKSELVGKHQRILHPPEKIEGEFSRTFKQHLKEKEGQVLETQVITKKGEIKDVAIKASTFELEGQKMILGTFRDITERKQTEEKIREKTEDLTLINSLNNAINRGDPLRAVIQLLSRETKKIFSSLGATIYLLSEDKEHLVMQKLALAPKMVSRIEKLIGIKISETRIPLKAGSLYRKALQASKPQLINDPATIQSLMAEFTDNKTLKKLVPNIYSILGIRSVINVPLVSEGEAIGLLDISRKEPFTESDVRRFETISGQLTALIRRKQAEEALGISEERYKKQFEEAMDAILIADAETGIIVDCNRVASELVGREKSELVGKHQRILHPPGKIEGEFSRTFKQHLKEKEGQVLETQVITKKGEIKDVAIKASTFELEGQKMILGTFRDITEQKRAEEATELAYAELDQIFATSADGMRVIDIDFNVLRINETFSTLARVSKDEALGKKCYDVFAGPACHTSNCPLTQILGGEERFEYEVEKERNDGIRIPCIVSATPFRGPGGELIGIVENFKDITERKRAEEALQEKEENFRAVAENANEGILVAVGEAAHVYVNKRAAEITGYTMAELLETDMKGLIHPDEFEKIMERYRKRVAGKPVPTHYETIFIHKDGKNVPVEFTAAKTVWQGEPASVVFFRDITERKRAEEAYRSVVDYSLQGLVIVQDFQFVFANQAFAEISGYTIDDLLSLSPEEVKAVVHPEDQALVWGRFLDRLEGKPLPPRYEYRGIQKDGTVRWLAMFANAIEYHGRPAVQAAIVDITERKQAEEALRDEKALMDALMDNIPDSIYFKDRQCRLTRINRKMMRDLNLDEMSQALGKTDLDLFGEEFGRETLAQDQRVMTRGEPIIGVIESRQLEDGQINWTSTTKVPLRDASGQIVGLVGATREINEVKQAEEEVQKRLREITALHRVSEVINATLDLKEVFQRVVEELSSTFNYRLVGIYLMEEEGLRLQAQVGYDSKTAPDFIPLERGVVGRVGRTGQPAFIRDVSQDPDYVASHPEITCEICVPVMSGGTILGALNVESDDKRPLTEDDLQLLFTLSSHIGVAIDNAHLYEHSRKRVDELSGLHDISQAFSAMTDELETFGELTKRIAQLIGCQTCFIATYDQRAREMHAEPPGYGISDELLRSFHYKVDGPARESWNFRLQGPLLANDHTQIPDFFSRWIQQHGIFNLLAVPLSIEGRITGLAYAANKPGGFAQDDTRLLTMFASQAAIAIENARLYEETQKRLRETTALHRVSEVINSTLDLKEVFQRVVKELSDTFGYRLVDIYLLEEGGLRLQANVGYDTQNTIDFIPLERGVIGRVARTGQPVILPDVTKDPDYIAPHPDITCEICVPVMSGGTILGTLNVESDDKRPLTEDDLQLLFTLSSHIGVAIENARLYDKTQLHLKEMTTLQRIGMELTSSLHLSTLLQSVAESTRELINADYVHIFALDPESGEFTQRAAAWPPQTKEPPITWPRKNKGLTAAVLKAQEPVIIERATDSPIYDTPETRKWDVKSVAGFPLKGISGLMGVLNVVFLQPHKFSKDERDLLALLADQAAIAIENARLYEETQKLAITDGLTGLYNLRYFYETLEKEIQRSERYHRSLSLIIVDIDDFKVYNDRHGHLAGDHLLMELAQLMSKVTRQTDTLARYGGEEFAIILPETETKETRLLAERLQKEVRKHRFSIQDGQTIGRITISLGVATYPHHADSVKSLFHAADKALLRAKQAGKNRISVCGEELTELELR